MKFEEIHKEKEQLEKQLEQERLEAKKVEEVFAQKIHEMEAQWQGSFLSYSAESTSN